MIKSIKIFLVLTAVLSGILGFSTKATANIAYANSDDPTDVNFRLVNELRRSKGLHELKRNASLDRAAEVRARELDEYFSHTRPNGTDPYTAMTEYGYDYTYAAENIAYNEGYPVETMGENFFNSWKNSPPHYESMISPKSKEIGIGMYSIGDTWYAVQLFGMPANDDTRSDDAEAPEAQAAAEVDLDDMVIEMVYYINNLRRSNNVEELYLNPVLERAALTRARELAGYWSNERPDGTRNLSVLEDAGYEFLVANIFYFENYKDDAKVVEGLYLSMEEDKGDKKDLLDEEYKDIGVAYYKFNEAWYVVILLASEKI